SALVGSAAFTQIHEQGNDRVRLAAGLLGILSALLASLQTFFKFQESAEKYRTVGIGYEKVEEEIEEFRALGVHGRKDVQSFLDSIRKRMSALADGSPEIPRHRHSTDSRNEKRREVTIARRNMGGEAMAEDGLQA